MKSHGSRSKSQTQSPRRLPRLRRRLSDIETKAAGVLPGLKTKLTVAAGAIGSTAALIQQYVSGLPLDKIISVDKLLIVNVVLFTLAFWFRQLTDKNV